MLGFVIVQSGRRCRGGTAEQGAATGVRGRRTRIAATWRPTPLLTLKCRKICLIVRASCKIYQVKKLTSLRPSRRPRDLDCRNGRKALSASMREERSGSALVAAVRSAQERRALRRLSSRCLARERRGAGASSSGSLHTSRAACTVCLRRDTGGDVSRDTRDSNIVTHYLLCRFNFASIKSISTNYSATSNAYNQTEFCDDYSRSRRWGDSMASRFNMRSQTRSGVVKLFGSLTDRAAIVTDATLEIALFVIHSRSVRTVTDGNGKTRPRLHVTITLPKKGHLNRLKLKIHTDVSANNGCWCVERSAVFSHGLCIAFSFVNLVTALIL